MSRITTLFWDIGGVILTNGWDRGSRKEAADAFDLRKSFQVFFSSCYIHSRKPEEGIFRVALAVTQRAPEECVFIDDRPLNLESPRRLGFSVIHYQSPDQLRTDLRNLQVEV